MVSVAQLVRASVCGTEGRGFETHHSPHSERPSFARIFTMADRTVEKPSRPSASGTRSDWPALGEIGVRRVRVANEPIEGRGDPSLTP